MYVRQVGKVLILQIIYNIEIHYSMQKMNIAKLYTLLQYFDNKIRLSL